MDKLKLNGVEKETLDDVDLMVLFLVASWEKFYRHSLDTYTLFYDFHNNC